jgi:xanthine dehydrogenase YagR molybdenum-binding subunit
MAEKITTTLNGQQQTFEAEIETSALELIREKAGLTGTKLVCGSGACGACTVIVDGEARCSCLMPAIHLDGKQVLTVEGHASNGDLHPVQKAFLAHDALQCGYCTPGFINEGIAYYDEWRKANGKSRPTRDHVAAAMAGHLCRCGAYIGIYDAILDACAGKFDGPGMPEYLRVDGLPKVTGAAQYTTDVQLPGQLVGLIFRSTHPHSRIKKLELTKAMNMPGVKAVIRLKEEDASRYEGEPLVAVAAETHAQAYAALKAIVYEFEPQPYVIDAREARKPAAPLVWQDGKGDIPAAAEGPVMPGTWENNVRKVMMSIASSDRGKAKRLTKNANPAHETHFSATFHTPTQFHTTLEPHCAVANWREDPYGGAAKLTVYASTQAVYWIAKDLAKHYKLKDEDVEVIADFVGGAFGSKLAIRVETHVAIELSRAAKAPVAVIYSRAEEFNEAGYRPPSEIMVTITSDADGKNAAYSMDAYGSSGIAVGSNIADVSGLGYTGIAKTLQDYDVVTNFPPGTAFRAPGGPAACFALEQSIDQLAHKLKLSPLEFRKRWEEHEGYLALFKWVEGLEVWQKRKETNGFKGRGVGLAFGGWMHIFMPSAEVEVEAGPNGLVVRNAVQDMGQGAKSVLAKAVADVFGVPVTAVKVEAGNSKLNIGPASGGSRTTVSIYPAAREAAEKLRSRILGIVTEGQQLADATLQEGGIKHAGGFITWKDALQHIATVKETATRGRNEGFNALGMMPLAQGMALGKDRSYAAYVVEVEVDRDLGKVRVLQVHGAMRAGKIHVKPLALSQCYGGVIQGIGHALYEDRAVCNMSGRILTRGLEDYRIPGIGDIPPMDITFLEEGFEFVKQGGIGLAELCTIPVAAAIANAVYNATGWRPYEAPITPERVLKGLHA